MGDLDARLVHEPLAHGLAEPVLRARHVEHPAGAQGAGPRQGKVAQQQLAPEEGDGHIVAKRGERGQLGQLLGQPSGLGAGEVESLGQRHAGGQRKHGAVGGGIDPQRHAPRPGIAQGADADAAGGGLQDALFGAPRPGHPPAHGRTSPAASQRAK